MLGVCLNIILLFEIKSTDTEAVCTVGKKITLSFFTAMIVGKTDAV